MADEGPIGITVVWKGMRKRLWLSGPEGAQGREALQQALTALDQGGDAADDWPEFLAMAVRVFKDHGFVWVDN